MLKKAIIALALTLTVLNNTARADEISRGQKTFGLHTGYVTLNKSALAGIEMSYAFSPHFVLAPSVDYVFRNKSLDGLLFNIDYHGPWALDMAQRWHFYHILGLNYASWSTHLPDDATPATDPSRDSSTASDEDVTTRYNRFGMDFGAGITLDVTPTLRLNLQGKFNWLKHHNTGLFSLGINYVF